MNASHGAEGLTLLSREPCARLISNNFLHLFSSSSLHKFMFTSALMDA